MKRARIKICGITNRADAVAAAEAGADALGFVFYKKSPRYISPDEAEVMCRDLPANVMKIGVFVNENRTVLEEIEQRRFLDVFQFSGDESPADCSGFAVKTMKAFRIGAGFDINTVSNYSDCDYYLFDKARDGEYGGTGEKFDWSLITGHDFEKPVVIAGGLSPENVGSVIGLLNPYMVDVSSGVEFRPGKKDHELITEFIKKVKSADNRQ